MEQKTVGHYRIIRSLGRGGMGEVYLAEDTKLERPVAIKILPEEYSARSDRAERLKTEAKAAAALTHNNVARIYSVEESEGRTFITMEYIDGVPLGKRIPPGGIGLKTFFAWCIPLAEALLRAHERGITHRDIKPDNILITSEGVPKILDFGLARIDGVRPDEDLASLPTRTMLQTQEGMILGTVPYMSPEQVEGKRVDGRSDIFSFGAVMYEMLTGHRPFKGETNISVISSILKDQPGAVTAVRADLPQNLADIVLRCLEKNLDQRYQSMGDVLNDLVAAKKASESEASVSGPAVKARLRLREKKALCVAGLIVTALAAVVILFQRTRTGGSGRSGPTPRYSSVAMLPLQNASDQPSESDYLSDGISESLITKLSQVPDLRVTPWMSAQYYKKPAKTPQALAREMGVEALITGTLRKQGDQIKISLSLIDGKNGFQVWGDEFQRSTADIFVIQNDVSVWAATKLQGKLAPQQEQTLTKAASTSAEAYEYYLRGKAAIKPQNPESYALASALLKKAIELDPHLAEAYASMGNIDFSRYSFWGEGGLDLLNSAEENFRHTLTINPSLASALNGLIYIYFFKGQLEEALKVGQKAASLGADSVEYLNVRAHAYNRASLDDKALVLYQRILKLDPTNRQALSGIQASLASAGRYAEANGAIQDYFTRFGEYPALHMNAGLYCFLLGDFDQAIKQFEKSLVLDPATCFTYLYYGGLMKRTGRLEQAQLIWRKGIDIIERTLKDYPRNFRLRAWLAKFYGCLGDRLKVDEQGAVILKDDAQNGDSLSNLGRAYALLGDQDRALALVRQAFGLGSVEIPDRDMAKTEGWEWLVETTEYQALLKEVRVKLDRWRAQY